MTRPTALVLFSLDSIRYALRLAAVQGAVRAVALTPLPKAPEIVLGVINLRGAVIPVLNIRRRFALTDRPIDLSDHFLIARTARRTVALWVDSVNGVISHPQEAVLEPGQVVPGMAYVEGVMKLGSGLVFIHNLDSFLALPEEEALQKAMHRDDAIQPGSPTR